jgi:hypothetical protein
MISAAASDPHNNDDEQPPPPLGCGLHGKDSFPYLAGNMFTEATHDLKRSAQIC